MSRNGTTRATIAHQAPPRNAPQQARAAQTRAQVLAAAAELFADRGYPHTSIDHIARQVGMTKGAVYFHFRDKQDIAAEIVRELYNRWRIRIDEAHAMGLPPMETVQALLANAADKFFEDDIVKAGARIQAERSLSDTTLPEPYVEWISTLSTLLAKASGAGQLREGMDPESAAYILVSAFFGLQHLCDVLNRRADLPRRWAEMSRLLYPSIAASPQ
ncbi:ScbR family autoregulator-binding transcription factor [Sphaerisporangium sp. NPDC004334]